MTPEAMRTELTRLLESWNSARSKYDTLKLDELIIERMRGMIELALHLQVIDEPTRDELNYIYFDDGLNAVEADTED